MPRGDAAAQLEELQRTQKRKTVRAAIVAADDRTTAASLAQQLAQTGLPVILAGAAPEEGLVETGNIWYVGSDPASGGELFGRSPGGGLERRHIAGFERGLSDAVHSARPGRNQSV